MTLSRNNMMIIGGIIILVIVVFYMTKSETEDFTQNVNDIIKIGLIAHHPNVSDEDRQKLYPYLGSRSKRSMDKANKEIDEMVRRVNRHLGTNVNLTPPR